MLINSQQALAIALGLIREKFGVKTLEKYAPFEATKSAEDWLITTQKIVTSHSETPGTMLVTRGGGEPIVVLGVDGQLISASLLR